MLMTPPQAHTQTELLFRAGMPPMRTVGEPGVHGAVVAGMQGIGVRTPRAAAVAAATVGLEGVVHMPKGLILTMGAKSMMVRAGVLEHWVRAVLVAVRGVGIMPKAHLHIEPVLIKRDMRFFSIWRRDNLFFKRQFEWWCFQGKFCEIFILFGNIRIRYTEVRARL